MSGLPWLVKKLIDFDCWFNISMLHRSKSKTRSELLMGAISAQARKYILSKFS